MKEPRSRFGDILGVDERRIFRSLGADWVGDEARVVILLKDGRKVETFIEHAIGSVQNPMSDHDLEVKFAGVTDGVLPLDRSKRVMELCWSVLPKAAII
jgi:2-methylcitrate dehydratase PrpD